MLATSRASSSILFSQTAAMIVMLVGFFVFMGWLLDIAMLKSIAPNLVSMKANTATLLFSSGLALFLFNENSSNAKHQYLAQSLATLGLVVATLTLFEYILSMNFGIDEFIFLDNTHATATSTPGRMAPITAICLILCNLALLLMDKTTQLSQKISMVVLTLATLGLAGYIFGVQSLYRVSSYTSIALHTTMALLILSLGIIAARTKQGDMAIMLSNSAGGLMSRRLLWLIPMLLFMLSWLSFQGQRADFYDARFNLAALTVTSMLLSTVIIIYVARKLHTIDEKRELLNNELLVLVDSLEGTIAIRTNELHRINQDLTKQITERHQAEEEVRRLSVTDELTGLLNRRGFFMFAEQSLKTARRIGLEYALFFLDLDGLKKVNDCFGHHAGDEMIIDAAKMLKACFRDIDLIARLGGDEFAILATTDCENTDIVLARMQMKSAQLSKEGCDPLSYSVGIIHCLPTEKRSLQELLDDADALMYQQKQEHHRHQ